MVERDALPPGAVDYGRTIVVRERHLEAAFEAFGQRPRSQQRALARWRERNEGWVEDFALFMALKRAHGGAAWTSWAPELRDRKRGALGRAKKELSREIERVVFEQWAFDGQYSALHTRAAELGIGLIGDVPIFVAHDSADVWANREELYIDERGEPTVVAGVPPDYFSKTGQLWGNPLYRWRRMKKNGYRWWMQRLATTLSRFDAVRIDHFIGFHRCWEIPAGSETAVNGRYVPGPGASFFRTLERKLGQLPLIAEDLGAVTPEVKELRDQFGLPGIRVLQFAFGGDVSANDFLPHNYPRRAVVYTGTHDNDTVMGWFHERPGLVSTRTEQDVDRERRAALEYLASDGKEFHWDMIRGAWASVANVAIVPAQDLLGLGTEARMNRPASSEGNWTWRLLEGQLDDAVADRLARMTTTYGRG
jgi:4-alpha-glucanotransferase